MEAYFKPLVYLHRERKDKSFSVIIRISYKKQYALINTGYSVRKTELRPVKVRNDGRDQQIGEIKSSYIKDKCNVMIKGYNDALRVMDIPSHWTVQDVKKYLLDESAQSGTLDFLMLFDQYVKSNKNSPSIRIYEASYNHLRSMVGYSLPIDIITPHFLSDFESMLSAKMGSRGVNLYLSTMRTVYNWIMDEYEYKGYSFRYPFRKYKIPKARYPKTVALTKEQLTAIIEADITGVRANRARDIFMISLFTLGTNAKDLYQLEKIGSRIEYKRSKTKDIRDDEAFISLAVQPELIPYLKKYSGTVKALVFSDLYASPEKLNSAIRLGLQQVVKQINTAHGDGFLWDIDYYDARRTIASVMRNKLGISKDDVAQCLNHVDKDMRTTDTYIEQDFSVIDKSNRMFIDWLFKDVKITTE